MKTIKYFTMAALALLMTTACSNDDNDLSSAEPQQAPGITITAQLAPKSAVTRALQEENDNIVVWWAENEKIAILYNGKRSEAKIIGVDDLGVATITFNVAPGTADNTACTLVYPASAANEANTGLKTNSELIGEQDGQLSAALDVRLGAGTIQMTNPGLTVTTQPQPQFAIFKFTMNYNDGNNTEYNTNYLSIWDPTTDSEKITDVTPTNSENTFYVALPPTAAGTSYHFHAYVGGTRFFYKTITAGAIEAGKYYQTTLMMTEYTDK